MHTITVPRIPSANHYVRHWHSKHYKTNIVRDFENSVAMQLAAVKAKPTQKLHIVFVLDRNSRDLDNLPKVFIDCLERAYGFNDKTLRHITLEKTIDPSLAKKGVEKIMWEFV